MYVFFVKIQKLWQIIIASVIKAIFYIEKNIMANETGLWEVQYLCMKNLGSDIDLISQHTMHPA